MTDQIIDKIKKCMALSQSCEPNEAAAALKKAQTLMKKHGLSADDVALSDIKQSKGRTVSKTKKPPAYQRNLVRMISQVFGCKAIYYRDAKLTRSSRLQYQQKVSFVGFEPNPIIAGYTYEVLSRQLVDGRKAYLATLNKRMKKSTKTRRADIWADYWVVAVRSKAVALTLNVKQKDLIEKWSKNELGELKSMKAEPARGELKRWDTRAMIAGYTAGKATHLHHPVNGEEQLSIPASPL